MKKRIISLLFLFFVSTILLSCGAKKTNEEKIAPTADNTARLS